MATGLLQIPSLRGIKSRGKYYIYRRNKYNYKN